MSQFTPKRMADFISSISDLNNLQRRCEISAAIKLLSIMSGHIEKHKRDICRPLLESILKQVLIAKNKSILIHDERLCDSGASLQGNSRHTEDTKFAIYNTIHALNSLKETPLISICLRNPTSYLKSKYLRTFSTRSGKGLKRISPKEFIYKQSILENSHPGTSALTPAMHAEFIKNLQQHAFVKAFGFQELLASEDICTLMGLQDEDQYRFQEFPRENQISITKDQEKAIETEITQALKQYGFFERVKKSQIFD
ncbi:hypothetical protein [Synechococcus sp. UW69]|uniref:hypothetical protein n=1 Tax=Synechococcus sp. UW69 TaxID=368493 RepID=UPI0010BDF12D|nr:hypothetical protein [Synechococcus sp. UW69]